MLSMQLEKKRLSVKETYNERKNNLKIAIYLLQLDITSF